MLQEHDENGMVEYRIILQKEDLDPLEPYPDDKTDVYQAEFLYDQTRHGWT